MSKRKLAGRPQLKESIVRRETPGEVLAWQNECLAQQKAISDEHAFKQYTDDLQGLVEIATAMFRSLFHPEFDEELDGSNVSNSARWLRAELTRLGHSRDQVAKLFAALLVNYGVEFSRIPHIHLLEAAFPDFSPRAIIDEDEEDGVPRFAGGRHMASLGITRPHLWEEFSPKQADEIDPEEILPEEGCMRLLSKEPYSSDDGSPLVLEVYCRGLLQT